MCPSSIAEMVFRFPERMARSGCCERSQRARFVLLFVSSIRGSETICDVVIKRTVVATVLKTAKKRKTLALIFQRLNRTASVPTIAVSLACGAVRSGFSPRWYVSL